MEYLPVALFGSVMGLTGLSVAWRLATALYGAPAEVSQGIGIVAMLAFGALVLAYGTKIVFAPGAVRAEFAHPVAGSLFGTAFISLLLLPAVVAPYALRLAQGMWVLGAVLMLAFAWFVVDRWMADRQQVAHASPAWVVPVVGLLDVPIAVPGLGLPPMHGLMVACLTIGLFFAIPLFTLIFSRILFEPPLPEALQPTLMILVAPFAVGFLTLVSVSGEIDTFAEGLYGLTLFMLAILVGRLRRMLVCCPFRLAWWSVSFPLAAAAIAALRFAAARPDVVTHAIALVLLAFATLVIAALAVRTLAGILRGELRALSL
ncbi:C4-dicarboxylate ABC transporter [bacterium]|nr:C4-dicarboxylate ABC transporter [bacterium]